MGNGSIKKIGLIVNGDAADYHLENVEQASRVLEGLGYETYIANPVCSQESDFCKEGTRKGLLEVTEILKQKIDDDDDLFIYTTGHGMAAEEEGILCFGQDRMCLTDVADYLGEIPFGQRTIVADQCFGGRWAAHFLDDPRTLFISAGSKNETACCQEFSPYFWADQSKIPDSNHDGIINWQERYAYAVNDRSSTSTPQFLLSPRYQLKGIPSFHPKVEEIQTADQLGQALETLGPGQYAAVTFSASWCGPCKDYAPQFNRFAKEAGGWHLFLRTENEGLASQFRIPSYPTVMLFDHQGGRVILENREEVLAELGQSFANRRSRIQYPSDFKIRLAAVNELFKSKISFWGGLFIRSTGQLSVQIGTATAFGKTAMIGMAGVATGTGLAVVGMFGTSYYVTTIVGGTYLYDQWTDRLRRSFLQLGDSLGDWELW